MSTHHPAAYRAMDAAGTGAAGAASHHAAGAIANGHAAAAAAPAASSASAAAAADGDGDAALQSHLVEIMANPDEPYASKLKMFNSIMKVPQSSQLSQTAVNYLQVYPELLTRSFEWLSADPLQFDDLLRDSLDSVAQQVSSLSSAAASASAPPSPSALLLTQSLSYLLAWTVHAHPLVSEFGRSVWMLLHHTLDAPFASFALQIVVRMLTESCASHGTETANISAPLHDAFHTATPVAPPAHAQPQWQWRMNAAQNSLIELLAMVAPTLSRDDQMYLFRHFNLQLHASTPGAALSVYALCATEQLPLAMLSALLLRVAIPQLHVDIQQMLYAHTFNFCVLELEHLRAKKKEEHTADLPVLTFLLEMLTAAFRAPPAPPVEPLALAVSQRGLAVLMALLQSVAPSIVHSRLPDALRCALLEAMLRAVQQDLVQRHMTHTQWAQWILAAHQNCMTAPALRPVLGEVLVAVAPVRVPAEAQASFFTRSLQPAFTFLLSPPPAVASASGGDFEAQSFDAFFRFSTAAGQAWSRKFKELIPLPVYSRLVTYVQSRSKTHQQQRPEVQQRTTAHRLQRQAVFADGVASGLSGDQLAAHLTAEATQLHEQCAQEQQRVEADAATTAHTRQVFLAAYLPPAQLGCNDAWQLVGSGATQ